MQTGTLNKETGRVDDRPNLPKRLTNDTILRRLKVVDPTYDLFVSVLNGKDALFSPNDLWLEKKSSRKLTIA